MQTTKHSRKEHNIAVLEIRNLILSMEISIHYAIMNACMHNELQENTMPPWLLPCTCGAQRCHCYARLKLDMLCVIDHPYNHPPPETPAPKFTIQSIELHIVMIDLL